MGVRKKLEKISAEDLDAVRRSYALALISIEGNVPELTLEDRINNVIDDFNVQQGLREKYLDADDAQDLSVDISLFDGWIIESDGGE